jgi:hypothetical protein
MHGTAEFFNLTIALRMIHSATKMNDGRTLKELFHHVGRKMSTIVGENTVRCTTITTCRFHKANGIGNVGFRLDIGQGYDVLVLTWASRTDETMKTHR